MKQREEDTQNMDTKGQMEAQKKRVERFKERKIKTKGMRWRWCTMAGDDSMN